MAQGRGFQVDGEGFATALEDRRRARERFTTAPGVELPDLRSEFDGYARLTVPDARILYLRQGQEQVATAEASLSQHPAGRTRRRAGRRPRRRAVGGRRVGRPRPHPLLRRAGGRWATAAGSPAPRPPPGADDPGPRGRPDRAPGAGRVRLPLRGDVVQAEVDAPAGEATMRHHTPTSCTPPCAPWAPTCTRRGPWWPPTACASTSPTATPSRPSSAWPYRGGSMRPSGATSPYARTSCLWTRRCAAGPSRSSTNGTGTPCGC